MDLGSLVKSGTERRRRDWGLPIVAESKGRSEQSCDLSPVRDDSVLFAYRYLPGRAQKPEAQA